MRRLGRALTAGGLVSAAVGFVGLSGNAGGQWPFLTAISGLALLPLAVWFALRPWPSISPSALGVAVLVCRIEAELSRAGRLGHDPAAGGVFSSRAVLAVRNAVGLTQLPYWLCESTPHQPAYRSSRFENRVPWTARRSGP